MKDGFKSATIIATLNLLSWKKDYRIWSVGTVIMVLIIRYLIGVPLYALPNGKTSTALLLPVLLADAMNSNGLLKVLIFFGGILLFCDAPFLKDNKWFLIHRAGRKGWWKGECLYIAIASFIYMAFIAACSFLMVLPCLEWNGWGSIWEISSNKLMNYVLYSKVYPKNVISSTTVWNAAFYSYMVSSITVMLLGYLVYAFNVVTGKNWPGILAASCLVLADPVVIYFYHEQTSWMMLFSPVNWSSIENLKKYSGEGMLTSMYVYAVILSICAILMMVIKEKTHEMDL